MGSYQFHNERDEAVELSRVIDEAFEMYFGRKPTEDLEDVKYWNLVGNGLANTGLSCAMEIERLTRPEGYPNYKDGSGWRHSPKLDARDVKDHLLRIYQEEGLERFRKLFGYPFARVLIEFVGRRYHYKITAWH